MVRTTSDNGLALCSLHHKLFDRGVLGLDGDLAVVVSRRFSARTPQGKAVYDLHGRPLRPRPGTPLPAETYVRWHTEQVFQGRSLASSLMDPELPADVRAFMSPETPAEQGTAPPSIESDYTGD